MFVCICKPTTDRYIRQRAREYQNQHDHGNIKDFKRGMGVCQVCCKCNPAIRKIWNEERERIISESHQFIEK